MEIKENKGVTLIALVVTIIVLIMLAGIAINFGVDNLNQTRDNKPLTELGMVQNAVLQRKTKADLTKETLPGEIMASADVEQEVADINSQVTGEGNEQITLKGDHNQYYLLTEDNGGLKDIGIKGTTDEYIVNYETGEVINKTRKVTSDGKAIYIYAKEDN